MVLWGRVIFYVSNVDALYGRTIARGLRPDTSPREAEWGERYFHLTDPDGHELTHSNSNNTSSKDCTFYPPSKSVD
jgi:uncharacterized glyoxalase superfamily protein PhnB